jgi:hypothetical protein
MSIIHQNGWAFDTSTPVTRIGMMKKLDRSVELRYNSSGKKILSNTDDRWAYIELTSNGEIVCRSHVTDIAKGRYWCSHFNDITEESATDALFLRVLMKTKDIHSFQMILWITEDILKVISFNKDYGENWTISLGFQSFSSHAIAIITPEYEGLEVVRQSVISHYESWDAASLTMCQSSQHFRTLSTKTVTLKDRMCLDELKMCYSCAKRSFDAVMSANLPANDGGFDSLPKSATVSPGSTPTPPPPAGPSFASGRDEVEWKAFKAARAT